MGDNKNFPSFILGALLCFGLIILGSSIAGGIIEFKALDRTVTVKGLSEREVNADIAIWPIQFDDAANELNVLSNSIQNKNNTIVEFLKSQGFADKEITVKAPAITDRFAQGYTSKGYRYTGKSTINVYTDKVDLVRTSSYKLVDLAKQGIAVTGNNWELSTKYIYTGLNKIKPEMIEEATKNARVVAEKFANDSDSELGKIKRASQGQFSISDRDANTPHIKKVRIVSTLVYYLSD